ncbi:YuzD family protein [Pseudogracilibacillus sp. SO30301A]|uniref:YuzD family protein n=1 Tax=Pseudogracilibacillus sp. SO30301A TaxID=3098291 RepID=UPI00300E51FA
MSINLKIEVYGRNQICASCVGAPGSKDTYEWLQAAISRKYGTDQFSYKYIDMDNPEQYAYKHQEMIKHIVKEDLFYPLILLDNDIISEGVPHLRTIFKTIEAKGIRQI